MLSDVDWKDIPKMLDVTGREAAGFSEVEAIYGMTRTDCIGDICGIGIGAWCWWYFV